MYHENKMSALHHIYSYSNFAKLNDYLIQYIFSNLKSNGKIFDKDSVIVEEDTEDIVEQIALESNDEYYIPYCLKDDRCKEYKCVVLPYSEISDIEYD